MNRSYKGARIFGKELLGGSYSIVEKPEENLAIKAWRLVITGLESVGWLYYQEALRTYAGFSLGGKIIFGASYATTDEPNVKKKELQFIFFGIGNISLTDKQEMNLPDNDIPKPSI